jgi:hypothetical protein
MFCQQGMAMAAPPAAAPAAPDCDAAPVPWLAFAADDKSDDLDADLAQLITLPGDMPKHNSSSKSSSSPSGKPQLPTIKRVNSTSSAYSSGEALAGAAAAPLMSSSAAAGSKAGSVSSTKQPPKVLRIRSIKGAPGSAGKPVAGRTAVSSAGKAPAGPSCKSSTNSKPSSTSNNQQKAAAAGLGPAKAGVQKKAPAGANNSSKVKLNSAAAATAHKQQVKLPLRSTQQKAAAPKAVAAPAASPVMAASAPAPPPAASPKTAPPTAVDESALSLLGDLDSGLSDTCFGSSGDDMAIDSFAYLDELLLQESSEDAWEGLLGGSATAEEMELCSSLASH